VINSYDARVASSVVWYATGDKDAVLAVLRDVKFIGKRRASGYGEVIRWEAEDGELDGLVGYLNDPLRPVPADRWTEGGDQIAIDTAWKPPYWAIENRAKCYAPEVT
jgi:CRISPR type IV-associated protein Csf3